MFPVILNRDHHRGYEHLDEGVLVQGGNIPRLGDSELFWVSGSSRLGGSRERGSEDCYLEVHGLLSVGL